MRPAVAAGGWCGRWGCVENDVRVILRQRRIGQQGRELVEGGDFRGAGTRQGFFDAIHYRIGQHASHRADYAVTVPARLPAGRFPAPIDSARRQSS
jgi:hypothetical protein